MKSLKRLRANFCGKVIYGSYFGFLWPEFDNFVFWKKCENIFDVFFWGIRINWLK